MVVPKMTRPAMASLIAVLLLALVLRCVTSSESSDPFLFTGVPDNCGVPDAEIAEGDLFNVRAHCQQVGGMVELILPEDFDPLVTDVTILCLRYDCTYLVNDTDVQGNITGPFMTASSFNFSLPELPPEATCVISGCYEFYTNDIQSDMPVKVANFPMVNCTVPTDESDSFILPETSSTLLTPTTTAITNTLYSSESWTLTSLSVTSSAQPSITPVAPSAQPSITPVTSSAQPSITPVAPSAQPSMTPVTPSAQPSITPDALSAQPSISKESVVATVMVVAAVTIALLGIVATTVVVSIMCYRSKRMNRYQYWDSSKFEMVDPDFNPVKIGTSVIVAESLHSILHTLEFDVVDSEKVVQAENVDMEDDDASTIITGPADADNSSCKSELLKDNISLLQAPAILATTHELKSGDSKGEPVHVANQGQNRGYVARLNIPPPTGNYVREQAGGNPGYVHDVDIQSSETATFEHVHAANNTFNHTATNSGYMSDSKISLPDFTSQGPVQGRQNLEGTVNGYVIRSDAQETNEWEDDGTLWQDDSSSHDPQEVTCLQSRNCISGSSFTKQPEGYICDTSEQFSATLEDEDLQHATCDSSSFTLSFSTAQSSSSGYVTQSLGGSSSYEAQFQITGVVQPDENSNLLQTHNEYHMTSDVAAAAGYMSDNESCVFNTSTHLTDFSCSLEDDATIDSFPLLAASISIETPRSEYIAHSSACQIAIAVERNRDDDADLNNKCEITNTLQTTTTNFLTDGTNDCVNESQIPFRFAAAESSACLSSPPPFYHSNLSITPDTDEFQMLKETEATFSGSSSDYVTQSVTSQNIQKHLEAQEMQDDALSMNLYFSDSEATDDASIQDHYYKESATPQQAQHSSSNNASGYLDAQPPPPQWMDEGQYMVDLGCEQQRLGKRKSTSSSSYIDGSSFQDNEFFFHQPAQCMNQAPVSILSFTSSENNLVFDITQDRTGANSETESPLQPSITNCQFPQNQLSDASPIDDLPVVPLNYDLAASEYLQYSPDLDSEEASGEDADVYKFPVDTNISLHHLRSVTSDCSSGYVTSSQSTDSRTIHTTGSYVCGGSDSVFLPSLSEGSTSRPSSRFSMLMELEQDNSSELSKAESSYISYPLGTSGIHHLCHSPSDFTLAEDIGDRHASSEVDLGSASVTHTMNFYKQTLDSQCTGEYLSHTTF